MRRHEVKHTFAKGSVEVKPDRIAGESLGLPVSGWQLARRSIFAYLCFILGGLWEVRVLTKRGGREKRCTTWSGK